MEIALAVVSLALGLSATATLFAIGYVHYTTYPYADAWDYWSEYLSVSHPITLLFDRMNEHRIVLTRLLQLADLAWFRADSRLLLASTYVLQFGSAAALYRLVTGAYRMRPAQRVYTAGLILAFGFAPGQMINFTWLFLNGFLAIPCATMWAFVLLKNSVRDGEPGAAPSMKWVMAALAMAIVATGSLSNGVLVWPLLIAMAVALRLPRRTIALIAMVGVAIVLAYLSGNSQGTKANILVGLQKPRAFAIFMIGSLGSATDAPTMALGAMFGRDWTASRLPVALLAGAMGIVASASLGLVALLKPQTVDRHRIALLFTLAFFLGTGVLIGLGRAWLPLEEALTGRYSTVSVLFFACLLTMAASAEATATLPRRRYRVRLAALMLAVLVGGVPQLYKVRQAVTTERYLAEGEYALINGVLVVDVWTRFFYQPGRMIQILRYFREHRLSLFSREWTTWIGDRASQHFVVTRGGACVGAWEASMVVGGSYTPAMLATGWAYDRRFNRAPDLLVFADGSDRIVGYASGTRPRPDLTSVLPPAATERVGWVAFLPAGLPLDATVYARLGDGLTLCRLDAKQLPGTFLTAPLEKAGEVIPGVQTVARGNWSTEPLLSAAGAPVLPTVWSSRAIASGEGMLRLGPVPCGPGSSIGLPLATSSPASSIRVSIVERETGNLLAVAVPAPGLAGGDLWRLDVPAGAPAVTCDYIVEDSDGNPRTWIAAGPPRTINP